MNVYLMLKYPWSEGLDKLKEREDNLQIIPDQRC
jgi:hypothetical protein